MENLMERTEILEVLDVLGQLSPEDVHMVRWFTFLVKDTDISGRSALREHILNVFPGEDEMDDDDDDDITPEEATQEILDDPELMEMIRRGEEGIAAGRTVSWESVR